MTRRRISQGLPIGFALLLASSIAAPQMADKPAAETLFERGRELLAQRRTAEACTKFEASHEIDAGIGTLLYLGDCYEKLGRTASAWATFKEAVSLAQSRSDEREQLASIRAAALEPRLARLTLRVPEAHRVAGLALTIGPTPVRRASWGVGLPIDPGLQRVTASAPDHEPWVRSLRVAGRGHWVIDVPRLRRLVDAEAAIAEPAVATSSDLASKADPRSEGDPGRVQRTVALVVAGLGVAALAGGTVLAVQAQRKNDASLEHCPNDEQLCSARGKTLRDDAFDYAHASTAVFAAGGALVAAALVVHFSAPSRPAPNVRSIALGARVDGAGGQVRLAGEF